MVGCGRKQRNIFVFKDPVTVKISTLDLPMIKELCIEKVSHGIKLSWSPINFQEADYPAVDFCGYHVYRFTKAGIIQKNPINKQILKENFYVDLYEKHNPTATGYLIRAVFMADKQIIQGPASRIIKTIVGLLPTHHNI